MMNPDRVEEMIKSALADARVEVRDFTGGGDR